MRTFKLLAGMGVWLGLTSLLQADPCGMVPPITPGNDVPIARIGVQKTYVFYKDGIETMVLRPGFQGNVEEFGMLIPFPAVPAIRKVPDNVFPQIAAAIDPPEVDVYLYPQGGAFGGGFFGGGAGVGGGTLGGPGLMVRPRRNEVRVVKQEAVGMYEVAVLDAGSASALKRWMTEHRYRYPDGMEDVCEDYIKQRWCFVAVKTRVGAKAQADPQPGQREAKPKLPAGGSFDGYVQAMGFRFLSKRIVIPMRLSTFNKAKDQPNAKKNTIRNVIYLLTTKPAAMARLSHRHVVRQVDGNTLHRNLTGLLPVRIHGANAGLRGQEEMLKEQLKTIRPQRNPEPHSGVAAELFASDLLSAAEKTLSHPHEEEEKALLSINERLGLRDESGSSLVHDYVSQKEKKNREQNLEHLKEMTLSVIDGHLPKVFLARQNILFRSYRMPATYNNAKYYNARMVDRTSPPHLSQRRQPPGILFAGTADDLNELFPHQETEKVASREPSRWPWLLAVGLCWGIGILAWRRR